MDATVMLPRRRDLPWELVSLDQWVCLEFEERAGRMSERPLDCRTGRPADLADPATWSGFDRARRTAKRRGWGLAFVLSGEDGLVGLALERAADPQTDHIEMWAKHLVVDDLETFAIASPDGTGVFAVVQGRIPGPARWKIGGGSVEVFDRARYLPMAGAWQMGDLWVYDWEDRLPEQLPASLALLREEAGGGAPEDLSSPWGFGSSGNSPPDAGGPGGRGGTVDEAAGNPDSTEAGR